MGKTYLFYDTETTGLNPCFDQIIQLAAIRTDEQFNKLEEYQFFIRLNPDVVPSPRAWLTHGISLSDLKNQPCEYETIQKIHAIFNTPNTISIGYNNLNFDDEFLRFSFYRNLLDPYTHQWAQGCTRLDLYPITLLYFLYQSEALPHWPIIDGKPSLKLEHLNASNQWIDGQAHDAMVDVRITLALAKQLRQHEKVWAYALGYFNKAADMHRLERLPSTFKNTSPCYEALLLHPKLGSTLNYQAPVLYLGQHQHYKNQTLWLRLDTDVLSKSQTDYIDQTTSIFRKRFGEPPFLLAPIPRFYERLAHDRLEQANENKNWLSNHLNILELIRTHYQHYKYPIVPNCDIDANLYQEAFLTREERLQTHQFHALDLGEKMTFIPKLLSKRLQQQAERLLARNYLDLIRHNKNCDFSNALIELFNSSHENKLLDYKGQKHLSVKQALQEIETLTSNENLSLNKKHLLFELKQYLIQIPITVKA